ncbi:AAA family ATPase [Mycolicibacter sinensis]|uniref:Uncharacterized protein n=1 Tax=Mycolicibacter sinensis (strain JDM601) TaxID=875328 RepID=A0A1A2XI41_MYCSD|nr:AAA family ATPase [Mycolicibacter sinensis]OBI24752.1 hypothetical protein A5710_10445 [Mycolicibacter sinensis]
MITTVTYDEHVAQLQRLRDDPAIEDNETYFRQAAWYFEFDKFVHDDDIQRVWDRQPVEHTVDEEAEEAYELQAEFGFVRVDFDEDEDPQNQEWLVNKLIPAGGYYGNWSATEGLGKSGLAQDLSVQMVLGLIPFTLSGDDSVLLNPRVLCLDYENPRGTYERRARMMPYEGLRDVHKHLFYARVNTGDIRPLDTYEGGQDVLRRALRCEADLVIIDTKTSSVEGRNNQDSTEYDFYRSTVRPLTERGVTVLVIDHSNPSDLKRPGGSKAKTQKLDFLWTLERVKEHRNADGELDVTDLVLTLRKDRANRMPAKMYIRRTSNPYHHELSLKPFKPLTTTPVHTDGAGDRVTDLLKAKYPNGKVGINEGYAYLKDHGIRGDTSKLKTLVRTFNEAQSGLNE